MRFLPKLLPNRAKFFTFFPLVGVLLATHSGLAADLGQNRDQTLPARSSQCHVHQSATGADDGSSWEDAYQDLQDAIADSSCAEIWVAQGSYKPHPSDRGVSFTLRNNLAIFGGFNGTELEREQRDWTENITILSGNIGDPAEVDDNSFNVVSATNTNNTAILDGFTITGGNADESWDFQGICLNGCGGGIRLQNASPQLANLIVTDNYAASVGGGISAMNNSATLNLSSTRIFSNRAGTSGAGMGLQDSNAVLSNVSIASNTGGLGTGLNSRRTTLSLENVTFSNNSAASWGSGGGMNVTDGNFDAINVTFSGNSARDGGGLHIQSGFHTLLNATFSNNSASSTNGGGGIRIANGRLRMNNVIIAGSTQGDCVYWGASAIASGTSHNLIANPQGFLVCGRTDGVDGHIIGSPALLDSLADNGGETLTHALLGSSPAIGAGTNTDCPDTDQRGVSRPQGETCDMGAYEFVDLVFGDRFEQGPG